MPDARFLAMRADLVERGLLDGEHRLTEAGNAYVEQLIADRRRLADESEPAGPSVRWNYWPARRWA